MEGQKESNTETLTSLDELDSPLLAPHPSPVFGSSMLFTFLFDGGSAVTH